MRALAVVVYLILSVAAFRHGHPMQLLPLTLMAIGTWIAIGANDSTDSKLAGAMVGVPVFLLGAAVEFVFLLGWLLF